MSTTTETYTQKAQAHIATAAKLSPTMRSAMGLPDITKINGQVVRVLMAGVRSGTLVALIKRGLIETQTRDDHGWRVHRLTDQGMFVWAAITRPADLLELAAKKDAEAEAAAQQELEARSCRDCAEEVGADRIARNGGYCDGCADNQEAVQRAEQDGAWSDPAVQAAVQQVIGTTPEPIGFDHFPRGAVVVRREDRATGRVESRYSDGKLAVVIDQTGGVHVAPWHHFALVSVDAAQPLQINGSAPELVVCENPAHHGMGGPFLPHLPADTCEHPHGIGRHALPEAREPETTEEMADTGPQGRDWPKNDRSSVATVTSILSANRLPGWCNASAQFVGYPPRAVLVHVPAGEDGTRYVQPLADALPYRNARVEFQPKPGSNLGGIVVVHPLHLEEAPCPSS